MSSRSKRMLSRVAQVSIVFLVLYCFTAVVIWIKWAEMKDLNFEARDITTLDVEDESGEYPDQAWKKNEFQCLGWVETDDDGDESGARRECWQRIQAGDAGYCEVMNTSSGQVLHVMQTTSLSLKDDARFTCELAQSFSSFRFRAMAYRHDPPMTLDPLNSQGIIMAVYENVLPSAFASVRRLRDVGCTLPIELWFRHNELLTDNPVLLLLTEKYGPIHLRQVFDERIFGFNVKVHALYYSHFTSVLLLDADNFAVKNPTPLFSSRAMKQYGAVFWLISGTLGTQSSTLHAQSLVWELLGLEYVDMPEQESGQVLVDRAVSKPMLEQLMYYATHTPNLFSKLKLVWGDKDLFRLTWLQMRKKFYYNDRRVPGTLGIVNHDRRRYCGVTMVQYDLNGQDMLFWHRNTIKLSGRDDRRVWHTLQELHAVDSSWLPKIQSFNGKKVFNETSCFGVKRFEMNGFVQMKRVDELGNILASLENTLIIYARQAYELLDNDDLD